VFGIECRNLNQDFKGEIRMSQNRTSTDFPGTSQPSGSGTGQTGTTGYQSERSTTPGISVQPESAGYQSDRSSTDTTGTGTATALAKEYGAKISDAATQAKEFVAERVTAVGDKIKDLQNVDLAEVTENAKDYARKNPGQTILISAAAGLLLGLIIRGRR
jgi:ElaB/YqjD/DUF883 family membrane-anchored ribosome-binding protein